MTTSKKIFAPCGINHLLTDSFYEADGVTWKRLGGWEKTIFQKHEYLSPTYRKFGPTNSQGYHESGVLGADYKLVWMNDLLGPQTLGIINKRTDWECGPGDNSTVTDNSVPNCGWWTNRYGENRRKGEDKYFKYEMVSNHSDQNYLWNMGHGSAWEDINNGNAIGTQPKSRESNVIGIDTWIHAEKQLALVGNNNNETRLGVHKVFGMYVCAMDSGRLQQLQEFLMCLVDENCYIDIENYNIEGRGQFFNSLVSMAWAKSGFEFSPERRIEFEAGNYNNEMFRELERKLSVDTIKLIYDIIRAIGKILDIIGGGNIGPDVWIGDIDFLITYDRPTPVNELVFYTKYQGETYNRRAEFWGIHADDEWGYKHVSLTCDPDIHAVMDVIGATWNGYLWNLSHTQGSGRVRIMRFANCFPIRTVAPGLKPDDPLQDKFLSAIHYWDKNMKHDDRRWNRTHMQVMDENGGQA